MKSIQKKMLVAGMIVTAAVGYLAFAGARQGWAYYVTVDQFATDARFHDQRVKLCGTVAADGLVVNRGRLVAEFRLEPSGDAAGKPLGARSVAVSYRGPIPDMFRAGCDAVVEGRLNASGVFQADSLLTKCASKYDADHGRNPHVAGTAPAAPAQHKLSAEVPS